MSPLPFVRPPIAKPPSAFPSATPTKTEGTVPVPQTPTVPQPSDPPEKTEQAVYPQTLPNGDVLLGVVESLPVHSVELIHKMDSSQKFPFLMSCTCGTQARVFTEADLRDSAAHHLALRAVREIPR